MKKMSVAVIALSLVVSMLGVANANFKNGMGGGCGNCAQGGVTSEQFRKFKADTIDLRQEMMTKRFEMQRENLKGAPDKQKLATLQAEITVLQQKIMAVRSQSGLPVNKCDGECGSMMGQKGMGGAGKGMMGGCNSPCGRR